MEHWLCGSCRADHRDMIVRYNLTDKDLRRALRAMLKYERLPLWRKLYSGPLYAICNTLAGWMLGKSLRMSEDCAYVDVAEGPTPMSMGSSGTTETLRSYLARGMSFSQGG